MGIRIEGLSRVFHPEMLENQVIAMLQQLDAPTPAKIQVVSDPINGRPLGYAHLDFHTEEEASLVASYRAVQMKFARGSIKVRFVTEGPRPPDHDHYNQK